MTNPKVERWAQALVDSLTTILGVLYVVSKAYDTNSDVYVKVALAAGGNNSVKSIVKLTPASPAPSGAVDSLGLTQTVYSPHVASVIYDITTPFSAGTTEKERAIIDWQVTGFGTHVDWYSKAVGAGNLAVTDIAAVNFVVGVDNIDTRNGAQSNL